MSIETNFDKDMKNDSDLKTTFKSQLKELGNFLILKLKSPFTIIGLALIIIMIIISIFPMLFTHYSLTQANGVFGTYYAPPSPTHPLGTTKFGRDVLARIVYGIPNSLIFGTITALIGLLGALIIGIPISLLNKRLKISAEIILILIFIIPLIYVMVYGAIAYPMDISGYSTSFGIYLIPILVFFFAKERLSFSGISKTSIRYIPLLIGYSILFYNFLAFIGFSDPRTIQLGTDISMARDYLYTAPWASLFPGIAIFVLLIGFFLLYAGLQESPKELRQYDKINY